MNERIKKLRRALDLTQHEFAARIGSVQNTITGYETGRRVPSNQVISLICKEFGVNESWLRNGDGEMFVPSPTSELDALAARYPQMTHETYVFIEKLVGLPEETQKIIMGFLREVVAGFGDVEPGAPALPGNLSSPTFQGTKVVDAEALYEKSLGFAPNTASSASNTTDATGSDGKAAGNT